MQKKDWFKTNFEAIKHAKLLLWSGVLIASLCFFQTANAAPTCTLSASPASVTLGQSFSLTWTAASITENTTASIMGSNLAVTLDNNALKAGVGILTVTPIAIGQQTYTMNLSDGAAPCTSIVTVLAAPQNTASITWPDTVTAGQNYTYNAWCNNAPTSATWTAIGGTCSPASGASTSCAFTTNGSLTASNVGTCTNVSKPITVQNAGAKPATTIACSDPKTKNTAFTCNATCSASPLNVFWSPTPQCGNGTTAQSSTTCQFSTSGSYNITANPESASAICGTGSLLVAVNEPNAAQISCSWPYYYNESFPCQVACNGLPVSTNWSLIPTNAWSCNPTNASATNCTLTQDSTVIASQSGTCNTGSLAINLDYRELDIICNPTTVRAGSAAEPGQSFTCAISGGDGIYTWLVPEIIKTISGSTATTKIFRIEINQSADMPLDGKVDIMVKDSINHSANQTITVVPPAPLIDELYTVGNQGIAKGAHEDVYVRVTALGWTKDISSLEIKLVKGAYSQNNQPPADAQIFNILDTGSQISLEENVKVQSGATTLYSMLYKIPIFIPEYYELTDGNYTFVVKIFDNYLQTTVGYLQTSVGQKTDGDINDDQSIDIIDIVKVAAYYLNPSLTPTSMELMAVDFNQNKIIDLTDVIKVIQLAMQE